MTDYPVAPLTPPGAPPAFHLLAKPSGSACNLDCAYCFFLDKELFYPGSKFRMSDALLEQYIRQLIESHQENFVNIAWQGGEPTLMGLDFYRQALTLADKYRRPGHEVPAYDANQRHALDDEWAAFFKEHNFLIGISLDGPPQLHDIYRLDKGGQPHVRPGDARGAPVAEARRRVQRADHSQSGQRGLSAGGLPLPA